VLLTLLALLIGALTALRVAVRHMPRSVVTAGSVGICGAVVVLAIVVLANGAGATTLELPIGPPGAAMHLAIDPLAVSFLLLLFTVMPFADTAPLPLAAMGTTALAGDGLTLAVGLLLLGGMASLRLTALAVVCLTVALALADPSADFTVIRAAPPAGWRAVAMLLLVLVGAGVVSRVSPALAIYLLLRVMLDLCGVEQPLWWGIPLLLAGAGIAVIGAFRAAIADTLHAVLSLGSLTQLGMAVVALGVAHFARAVDLPSVASGALAAVWLAVVCHVLCRTLLLRCADAVESGAGSRRLDRLGGLIHRMPITAVCCLAGLVAAAALPPGLGFAAFWLLFQSLLAAARFGDLVVQLLIVGVTAVVALSAGLTLLAMVRLFGAAFLGRPRMPRTAASEEAPRPVQRVLGCLAMLAGVFGVLPALALLPTAGWTHAAIWQQVLTLRAGAETPGYSPVAVALFLAIVVVAVLRGMPRWSEQRREPLWSDGFTAPPPWLPFGDPATQFGPGSFTEPLQRVIAMLPSTAAMISRLNRCRDMVMRFATALVGS
jgi:formate hydrogenlyase subunit 3/multisubunit Na+/H+ antiporter MnhD subunit